MARGKKSGGRDWKPGQSGNPSGRPKSGQALADLAREFLEGVEDGRQRKLHFIEAVYRRAINGSDPAARLMWSYIDGMPQRGVESEWDGTVDFHMYLHDPDDENPDGVESS